MDPEAARIKVGALLDLRPNNTPSQLLGVDHLVPDDVIAIVGSRKYPDLGRVIKLVEQLPDGVIVISGGAAGVDATARDAAVRRDLAMVEFKPIGAFGKKHPYAKACVARDEWFSRVALVMVAFWDGESTGTVHAMKGALMHLGYCVVVLPGCKPETWMSRDEEV